jgi:hypothetical protein
MRITHDKNEEPFGFCDANCGVQLKIGGRLMRVRAFINRYSWAAKKEVTPTEKPVTVTESVKPSEKKRASFADALGMLGAK